MQLIQRFSRSDEEHYAHAMSYVQQDQFALAEMTFNLIQNASARQAALNGVSTLKDKAVNHESSSDVQRYFHVARRYLNHSQKDQAIECDDLKQGGVRDKVLVGIIEKQLANWDILPAAETCMKISDPSTRKDNFLLIVKIVIVQEEWIKDIDLLIKMVLLIGDETFFEPIQILIETIILKGKTVSNLGKLNFILKIPSFRIRLQALQEVHQHSTKIYNDTMVVGKNSLEKWYEVFRNLLFLKLKIFFTLTADLQRGNFETLLNICSQDIEQILRLIKTMTSVHLRYQALREFFSFQLDLISYFMRDFLDYPKIGEILAGFREKARETAEIMEEKTLALKTVDNIMEIDNS